MIYVSSREEAIAFQQKEIERIQADQKAAEEKAAVAKREAEVRRAAESDDSQRLQRHSDIKAAQKEQERLASEKAEQAKAEQARVAKHQARIENAKATPRDPNLRDFDAKEFEENQREVWREICRRYPWMADGFYPVEEQLEGCWEPGRASNLIERRQKKQDEEINQEAQRQEAARIQREKEEAENAAKLAARKSQQETVIKEVANDLTETLNSLSGLDAAALASLRREIERRLEAKYNSISSK